MAFECLTNNSKAIESCGLVDPGSAAIHHKSCFSHIRYGVRFMDRTSDNSLRDWIALSFVIGVGSRTAAMLIDKFGSPAAVFEASAYALESAGLKRDTIDAIKNAEPLEKADREIEELEKLGAVALSLGDERYPKLLRETYDPPIVIYCLGDFASVFSQP